jgi:hypothetical protein
VSVAKRGYEAFGTRGRPGGRAAGGRPAGVGVVRAEFRLQLGLLDLLPERTVRRAVRIAVNGAAVPVRDRARANALAVRRYGHLAQSMRIKVKLYPSLKFVTVIGPSASFVRGRTRARKGKRKGQVRKFRPASYIFPLERGHPGRRPRPVLAPALTAGYPAYKAALFARVSAELRAAAAARQAGGAYRGRR